MRHRTTPFPEVKSILGVIYGVLLWADMNAATPLGAWGRSGMSLDRAHDPSQGVASADDVIHHEQPGRHNAVQLNQIKLNLPHTTYIRMGSA